MSCSTRCGFHASVGEYCSKCAREIAAGSFPKCPRGCGSVAQYTRDYSNITEACSSCEKVEIERELALGQVRAEAYGAEQAAIAKLPHYLHSAKPATENTPCQKYCRRNSFAHEDWPTVVWIDRGAIGGDDYYYSGCSKCTYCPQCEQSGCLFEK